MPFDPKLIHPDAAPLQASGEINLPDDLAALAEQLGDDAAHLSRCYPPNYGSDSRTEPRLVEVANRGTSAASAAFMRVVLIAGTSLATVAALGLSLSLGWLANAPADPAAGRVVQSPREIPAPIAETPSVAPAETIAFPSAATLSLGELSGPELEGLLDLWQRDPKSVASVSF